MPGVQLPVTAALTAVDKVKIKVPIAAVTFILYSQLGIIVD